MQKLKDKIIETLLGSEKQMILNKIKKPDRGYLMLVAWCITYFVDRIHKFHFTNDNKITRSYSHLKDIFLFNDSVYSLYYSTNQ